MGRLFVILLVAAVVGVLLFIIVFTGRSGGTNVVLADLWSKVPQVIYQPGTGSTAIVLTSTAQAVHRGDKFSVDDQGEAELRFPDDRLIVRVFRNSELALDFQGISAGDESKVDSFGVRRGAVFAITPQDRASRHVSRVDTNWAVIETEGTQFLVYYNPQTEITWVVVTESRLKVSAARQGVIVPGQSVTVPAGWQTWIEPGKPPQQPVPATRAVLNRLYPPPALPDLVNVLTNNALADPVVLSNQQCVVNTPGSSLILRSGPGTGFNRVDSMPDRSHFEGLGRTADAAWIWGLSSTNMEGWASAAFLQCVYNVQLLPVPGQAAPTPSATPNPLGVTPTRPRATRAPLQATSTPPVPPTPTAVPPAPTLVPPNPLLGSWSGTTDQGEAITFQVEPDPVGFAVVNLSVSFQFESSCPIGKVTFTSLNAAHIFDPPGASFTFIGLEEPGAAAFLQGGISGTTASGILRVNDTRSPEERSKRNCAFNTTVKWSAKKQ
jgi:hypothetical protein